jgi:hypothetical protein
VRAPNGTFVTFDVPAAVNGTGPSAINAEGAVTGFYPDVNFIDHTFLRASNGAVTTFDPPATVNGSLPSTITNQGAILGVYFDASFNTHGFLRSPTGAFSEINGPGGAIGQLDSFNLGPALSINPKGVIAGIQRIRILMLRSFFQAIHQRIEFWFHDGEENNDFDGAP